MTHETIRYSAIGPANPGIFHSVQCAHESTRNTFFLQEERPLERPASRKSSRHPGCRILSASCSSKVAEGWLPARFPSGSRLLSRGPQQSCWKGIDEGRAPCRLAGRCPATSLEQALAISG